MLPQSTFDKLSCMVITTDKEGLISLITDGFLKKTGYSRKKLIGSPIQKICKTDLNQFSAEGEKYVELITVDGKSMGTIANLTFDQDAGNVLWSFLDVSIGSYLDKMQELSRREAEIFSLRNEIESISSYTPVGLWRCDKNGSMTWVNEKFSMLVHLPKQECLGYDWLNPTNGDKDKYISAWKNKLGNNEVGFDLPIMTANGKHWVRLTGNRAGVAEAGYVGTIRDVTNERDLVPLLEELKKPS